jgi:V8-like Glu-specific endopeptidase
VSQWDGSALEHLQAEVPSFGDDLLLNVIDTDEREPVPNPDAYPWSALCRLVVDFGSHQEYGTGWLTSPRTVATAAHCVYSRQGGTYARGIEVWRQREGSSQAGVQLVTTGFDVARGWIENPDPEAVFPYDYGVVFVADAAGGSSLRPAARGDEDLKQADNWIGGFPLSRHGQLVYAGQTGLSVGPTHLAYRIDTSRGQSGSPVLVWDADSESYQVVGIHSQGDVNRNYAVRMRPPMVELYDHWAAKQT